MNTFLDISDKSVFIYDCTSTKNINESEIDNARNYKSQLGIAHCIYKYKILIKEVT